MQAVPGGAHYWDLGLSEGFVTIFYFAYCDDGEEEKRATFPIPEETMDDLEELLGDGRATVTVGKDLKVSDNFETAGSSCYVKLTCNQDLDTVLKAREIGQALALGFAEQGYEMARFTLNRILCRDVEKPAPLVITAGNGEEKTTKETKEPESGRKKPRQMKRPVLKGKNQPKFKR